MKKIFDQINNPKQQHLNNNENVRNSKLLKTINLPLNLFHFKITQNIIDL